MFGSWFGDFGATRAKKAAAKKRSLSKKTGRKSTRMAQTRKVPPRVYPHKRAMPFGPAYAPGGYPPPYEAEEESGFFPMGPNMPPGIPAPIGATVTIGRPTPHTQTVCGCKIVRMKNKREAIKCPGGPTGKGMYRFAKEAEIERAKAADNICTHIPVFGGRRGPMSPEARAARKEKRMYTFRTARGQVISLPKPSGRTLKRNVAYYYHMLDKRAKARGAKLRYMPSFADINGAYGSDWGW